MPTSADDDARRGASPAVAGGDHAAVTTMKIDLERAMARLSDAERAAIVQCYHNDLSHEEAAYVLGCPVGTVKTHVLRGKQKLEAALAAWAPPQRRERHEHLDPTPDSRDASRRLAGSAARRAMPPSTRADYIGDDGFTARVMQMLAGADALPAWRGPPSPRCGSSPRHCCSPMLPGTALDVAREAFTLFAARPFSLSTLAFVLVAIGVATWTAPAGHCDATEACP